MLGRGVNIHGRYLMKFLFVAIIPMLAVGIAFYIADLGAIRSDAVDMQTYRAGQATESIDSCYKAIEEIRFKIYLDNNLLPDTLARDGYLRSTIKNTLRAHNSTNKLCDNIQVYYTAFDGVYSAEGFTQLDALIKIQYKLNEADAQRFAACIRQCSEKSISRYETETGVLLLYVYPLSITGTAFRSLFFVVEANAFEEILRPYYTDPHFAMFDADGVCLYATDAELVDAAAEEGITELEIGGEAYVTFAVNSEFNSYKYVFAVSKTGFYSKQEQQRLLLIQISLMAMFAGVIIAVIVSRRSSIPIAEIASRVGVNERSGDLANIKDAVSMYVDSHAGMQQQLERNKAYIGDTLIERMLLGRVDVHECKNGLAEVGIEFNNEYFAALVVSFEPGEGASISYAHETAMQVAARIGVEYSPELGVITLEESYDNVITVLLNLKSDIDADEYAADFMCKIEHSVPTCIGMGRVYKGFENIPHSYTEAMIVLKQLRFVCSNGVIMRRYDEIHALTDCDSKGDLKETLLRFEQYIRQGNEEQTRTVLGEIYGLLGETSGDTQVRTRMLQAANMLIQLTEELTDGGFREDIGMLLRLSNFRTAFEDFSGLAEKLCDWVRNNRVSANEELGDKLREFVNENYKNPDISLEMLAEKFKLTTYYVSRRFSQCLNVSFREYVVGLRIEEAKRLLTETEMSIAEIVSEIGYTDASTFIRKFRQSTGVTPGNYRKTN